MDPHATSQKYDKKHLSIQVNDIDLNMSKAEDGERTYEKDIEANGFRASICQLVAD